jgi:carboxyl-terminal processing protease
MSRISYLLLFGLIAIGFLGAFLSGFFLNAIFDTDTQVFPILTQAYNIFINHSSINLPETTHLEYGMIRGLLESSGDPYATFQEPVQHELESNNLQGRFGGIGLEFSFTNEGDLLVFPIIDGPASRAGIQDGDILLQIDELLINPSISLDEIKAAIRGPIGEFVLLKITRNDIETVLEFDIQREEIHLPSVTWHIAPEDSSIGIIKVHIIAESTIEEIQNAVIKLQSGGASKFILDLRDNGGGLLSAGVDTARLFLKDGIIIQQQYQGQAVETFRTLNPGTLSDLPLVILINNNTASAAEIIAGSLLLHGRATIIGENSFGKDSIQLIFDLDDGSSLHITAAKWWIPGLIPPIHEGGLQPDILVRQGEEQIDLILNAAVNYFKEN